VKETGQGQSLPSYIFLAEMGAGSNRREEFERSYEDHLEQLSAVSGVRIAARAWPDMGAVVIDGETHTLGGLDQRHLALYAIEDPAVLVSDQWRNAVDAGAWATRTRGGTEERRHQLLRVQSWWYKGQLLGEE
jgi:hypothetical protein